MDRLGVIGAKVYRTDECGEIQIKVPSGYKKMNLKEGYRDRS